VRLFVDTEFTDLLNCDLISIGAVSEDGQHEFYGERSDFDLSQCNDFVRLAVLPQLGLDLNVIGTEDELGARLKTWLQQFEAAAPLMVCVDHPTDWEFFTYLVRDPETLAMPAWVSGRSISREVDPREIEQYWVANGRRAHHALHDARALRAAWIATQGRADGSL